MVPVSRRNIRMYKQLNRLGLSIDAVKYLKYMGIEDVRRISDRHRLLECQSIYVESWNKDKVILQLHGEDKDLREIEYINEDDMTLTAELESAIQVSREQLDDILDDFCDTEYVIEKKKHLSPRQKRALPWIIISEVFSSIGLCLGILQTIWLGMHLSNQGVSLSYFAIVCVLTVLVSIFWLITQYDLYDKHFLPYKKCPYCHSNEDVYFVSYGISFDSDDEIIRKEADCNGEKIRNDCDINLGFKYYCDYCEDYF